MKAQKTQTTFWKCQGWENYNVIIVSRIIHVKVDRRLNVTNKFKYQRRLSSRLPIVMFRGTPCMYFTMYPINLQGYSQRMRLSRRPETCKKYTDSKIFNLFALNITFLWLI